MKIHLLLVFLLLVNTQAQQQPCFCSCCSGQSCIPTALPTVYVQQCTLQSCIAQCQSTYPQCRVNYPNGAISVQCGSITTTPSVFAPFRCRCACCNTGLYCTPSFIGETSTYTCQAGSCSIACYQQYPSLCPSGSNGQTQGTCVDYITTTTTTTTIGPWLGNSCSCMCCQSGSYCTPTYVGTASASYCSSVQCTQACRIQYPSLCPTLTNIGQTSGTCTTVTGGNTICRCRCFSNTINNYINYDVRANGGCSACSSSCQQQTRCPNTNSETISCQTNNAETSLPSIFL
jgi:hypothetical protein